MTKSRSDISTDMRPIELGSPTIHQLLHAHDTASAEVMYYLETSCDAILECRQCRSLFRSLANFICHKRIYCKRTDPIQITASMRQLYSKGTVVVEPADPDESRKAKPTTTTTIQRHKRRKPVRQTPVPNATLLSSETVTTEKRVILSAIEGVSVAVNQNIDTVSVSDAGSTSLGDSMNASEPGSVTVVQPKDGYPNMNLRQRAARAKHIDLDDYEDLMGQDDESDEEKEGTAKRGMDVPFNPSSPKTSSTHETAAKVLAKRRDCDVKSLRCLNCNTRYSTIKTLHYHMTNTHGKQRKFYPCIYCDNVFSQFWGVTRHLKKNHHLTNEGINLIREKIRARIYTRTLNNGQSDDTSEQIRVSDSKQTVQSITEKSNPNPTSKEKGGASKANSNSSNTAAKSLSCETCGKEFSKKQYLVLHSVACSRKNMKGGKTNAPPENAPSKAATDAESTSTPTPSSSSTPAATKQNTTSPGSSSKTNKPLIFVCKTCSRAFSMRQNMTQHAAACARRHKHSGKPSEKEKDGIANTADTANAKDDDQTATKLKPAAELKAKESKSKEPKKQAVLQAHDDVLLDLSPSDSSKDEDQIMDTADTLLNNRPRRNIKPKQFPDGMIRIPEVVKIKQPDGSLVYKLREDVEALAVAPPSKLGVPHIKGAGNNGSDNGSSKDSSGVDILVEGQSVPLLGPDDEIKIERMVDMRKLVCLKCKKQYGSISNLRRHAVRHLGWRRFKCKLCKFTSYNKSECKTHLRKSHAKETSTLLDYGLHPYIIDLGALLDDTCEDNGVELSLNVSSTNNASSETSSPAAKSPNTRSRSAPTKPDNESNASATSNTTQSKSRGRKSDTPAKEGAKPRGRPRKHPAPSSVEETPSPDESSKRQKLNPKIKSSQTRDGADTPTSQPDTTTSSSSPSVVDPIKRKDQSSKLEGLVTVLKNRKPLMDTGGDQDDPSQTKNEVADNSSVVSGSTTKAENDTEEARN